MGIFGTGSSYLYLAPKEIRRSGRTKLFTWVSQKTEKNAAQRSTTHDYFDIIYRELPKEIRDFLSKNEAVPAIFAMVFSNSLFGQKN